MIKFLIFVIISFFSTLGFSYFYCKLTNVPLKPKVKTLFVFLIGVIILAIIRYYDISFISDISFFLYYPLLFATINYKSKKQIIFYTLIIWLYGMLLDLVSMLLVSLTFVILNIKVVEISWISALMSFFVFAFLIVLGNISYIRNITNKFFKLYVNLTYSNYVILLFTLIVFIVGLAIFTNINNLSISFVLTLLIVLILINFIFLIKYKINEYEKEKFIELIRENNKFYMDIDDENRIFKHNIIAKLLSIKSVSNKKARILLDDLIKSFNSNVDFSQHIKDIPYGLNGIIYQKIYPYLNVVNVKFNNEIDYDIFDVLSPRKYNVLVEKILLSIDNALESCFNSYEKLLIINLSEEKNHITIEIKNTFAGDIDLDSLGVKNYSTKQKNRGMGLYSIFRNKEVSVTVKVVNNWFVNKLEVMKI